VKDETRMWLVYAQENLASALVLLESCLFNPCLQNAQQAVEKSLKAYLVEQGRKIRKTHSIIFYHLMFDRDFSWIPCAAWDPNPTAPQSKLTKSNQDATHLTRVTMRRMVPEKNLGSPSYRRKKWNRMKLLLK